MLGRNEIISVFVELKVMGRYRKYDKVSGYNIGRWGWGQAFCTMVKLSWVLF